MGKILKTEALVLKNTRWSETSKIVHLFTRDVGNVKAIAKGALRPKSPFRGIFENLNRVEVVISFREGRGLQIISQAALIDLYSNVREDLLKMSVAFAIFELLQNLIHYNEGDPTLYQATVNILKGLDQNGGVPPPCYLLQFILNLSEFLGFGWNFSICVICQNKPTSFPLSVDTANGAIICAKCPSQHLSIQWMLNQLEWQVLLALQEAESGKLNSLKNLPIKQVNLLHLIDILMAHLNYHTEISLQLKSLKMYLP